LKKTLSAASASILGISSLAIPNMAMANVQACGTAPTGATLTYSNGVCQSAFTSSGTFSFTIPSGASQLAAVIVGAGGGAYSWSSNNVDDYGYSGNGGGVRYLDLSQVNSGTIVPVSVGEGGLSQEAPTSGGDSSLTLGQVLHAAIGGPGGSGSVCELNGDSYLDDAINRYLFLGVGNGAGGLAQVNDGSCVSPGSGVNPANGNLDGDGESVPTIFASYNFELGSGGDLDEAPTTFVQGYGQGGSVQVNLATNRFVSATQGSDGLVVFRWKTGLASTGSDSNVLSIVGSASLLMLAAGAVLVGKARRPKRKSN